MDDDKVLKFKQLRLLRQKHKLLNRKEVSKSESVKAQPELENLKHLDDDFEKKAPSYNKTARRMKDLTYSIDEIEKWEEKLLQKQVGFQNFEQLAEAAYLKGSGKTKVDQELYNKQMEAQTLQQGMKFDRKVPKEKLNQVVKDYKELNKRKLQKLNKKNNSNTGSFISDKNKQFNEKLDRHYGKYTKDIKESIERGTAL